MSVTLGKPEVCLINVHHGAPMGAELSLLNLLEALPEADRRRLLMLAPAEKDLSRRAAELGVRVLPWQSGDDNWRQNLRAFFHALKSPEVRGCRLFYSWGARGFEWAVLLAAVLGQQAAGKLADHPQARFHGRMRRAAIRLSAERMAFVQVPSEATRQACLASGWAATLHMISNIHDNGGIRAPQPGGMRVRVGFAGVYAAWKGLDTVAGWIRDLWDEAVEWHLFGEPSELTAPLLSRLLEEFPQQVTAHGRCSRGEIYRQIDLLVVPSHDFDPSAMVVGEAMMAGIPVVVSNTGGLAEKMDYGRGGFVYPVEQPEVGAEQLRQLVRDAALRERLSHCAHEVAAEYAPEAVIARFRRFWRLDSA